MHRFGLDFICQFQYLLSTENIGGFQSQVGINKIYHCTIVVNNINLTGEIVKT
ncbi:hypothetical protein THIOM_004810 [Candidatus Thiomargarita nelsonii]|uniref:Uncharacterized protein n=1 Tax=Candidatus Thiomargarita nelsonii TaxID=1003181 RepID=A0A176RUW9_9GAMM|nr:hypothetical protein THIOM_004810 [Candidatus Thiomargarita nelsonii]